MLKDSGGEMLMKPEAIQDHIFVPSVANNSKGGDCWNLHLRCIEEVAKGY